MPATTAPTPTSTELASALRRLYLVRFGFAVTWAALVVLVAGRVSPVAAALVVLYPLFDVGAAVVDARAAGSGRAARGLRLNMAISVLAAIGLGLAAASGTPAILRVWGAWAVLAGLVQLAVGVGRRSMGGQWPMILSGGISVLAGTGFVLVAGGADPSLVPLAGYALLGGVFFLVSALRLRREV